MTEEQFVERVRSVRGHVSFAWEDACAIISEVCLQRMWTML